MLPLPTPNIQKPECNQETCYCAVSKIHNARFLPSVSAQVVAQYWVWYPPYYPRYFTSVLTLAYWVLQIPRKFRVPQGYVIYPHQICGLPIVHRPSPPPKTPGLPPFLCEDHIHTSPPTRASVILLQAAESARIDREGIQM